ncbi:molybdate transport system substrate-binding protein [Halospina denitrificans]|uniref:Molybdate transport system substrate-binding protein n=1 Tax=Halospina denitrificans TaxID=332522 RepID=A0A4R7JTQ0_9GAMM|nr:molybdate ABC transporter substrate-binding protein [Halospina denitrificans]TDT41712.1 molybdate transport system substrate-binding protein [Halospina denitrificans]
MRGNNRVLVALTILFFLVGAHPLWADEIRVAAASNVTGAARALAERFEVETGHEVVLAFGSTGKHYAQIRNGAPFHAFLAADVERPRRLVEEGVAVDGSRFTYARGALVLWSPEPDYVDAAGRVLKEGSYRYLALANPRLAPYGRAARQVLEARGLWGATEGRRVMGENIAQTFQFVRTGNAELGFVAASQLKVMGGSGEGSCWRVPSSLHDPIDQQAVLIEDNQAAREFLAFVGSEQGRAVFREFGYEAP